MFEYVSYAEYVYIHQGSLFDARNEELLNVDLYDGKMLPIAFSSPFKQNNESEHQAFQFLNGPVEISTMVCIIH